MRFLPAYVKRPKRRVILSELQGVGACVALMALAERDRGGLRDGRSSAGSLRLAQYVVLSQLALSQVSVPAPEPACTISARFSGSSRT